MIGDECAMICIKCKNTIPDGSAYCNLCGASQDPPKRSKRRRGNGEGTVYKRGNYWQIELVLGYDANGNRIRRTKSGFRTKKEALDYVPTLKGLKPGQKDKARTLRYYYATWEKSDMPKLSSSKQTAYRIARRKLEAVMDLPLNILSLVHLRDIVAEEAPTFYPARDMKTLLSKLLTLAVADQQITVNYAEYITLPALNESERTPWSDDELRTIWTAYDNEDVVAAYLLLMIYSGMMPGELIACTKKSVDLDNRRIVGAGIKTDVRKQTPIVIADLIVPVVERILTYTPDGDDQRILYTDRTSFYDAYHAFTASAGIRDLPMYSCRHTTATALAVGTDVAPSIIQKIMRHAKFTTTQRYIHPDSSDSLAGINKLSRGVK